jgi:hypothetical protein
MAYPTGREVQPTEKQQTFTVAKNIVLVTIFGRLTSPWAKLYIALKRKFLL